MVFADSYISEPLFSGRVIESNAYVLCRVGGLSFIYRNKDFADPPIGLLSVVVVRYLRILRQFSNLT